MTASHRGSQRLSGANEVGKAAAKGLDAEQSLLIGERMIRLNRNNNPRFSESEGRVGKIFYHGCSMGMNIKDPEVHAMARQLAARRGISVTAAVRQALSAELERLPDALSEASVEARKEAVRAICRRTSANPAWQGLSSKELQDSLYDENGVPI